jgi:hypothetical protein
MADKVIVKCHLPDGIGGGYISLPFSTDMVLSTVKETIVQKAATKFKNASVKAPSDYMIKISSIDSPVYDEKLTLY